MGDEEFNPKSFFEAIRKSASVQAGAIMFGQAQVAYYTTLRESNLTDEQAYDLLAKTSEVMVKSVIGVIPALARVAVEASALWEMMGYKQPATPEKEVPGSGS